MIKCELCDNELEGILCNRDIIYACVDCQLPNFKTYYRQVWQNNKVIGISVFVDQFYILWDHLNNETCIYITPIGVRCSPGDIKPINWDWHNAVAVLHGIVTFPMQDLLKLKAKLQTYTLFS